MYNSLACKYPRRDIVTFLYGRHSARRARCDDEVVGTRALAHVLDLHVTLTVGINMNYGTH